MNSELLGTPLPDTPILWLVLLISILGALLTLLSAVEKLLEALDADTRILRPYGGLLFPVSWATWSILLLYWRFETLTVLVALMGMFLITAVGATLVRRCQG